MYELTVESRFAAAHRLRGYSGNCERLHGHNWRVEVCVGASQLNEHGMVMDFKKLRGAIEGLLAQLDHRYLNEDVEDFRRLNPTTENIARWVFVEMSGKVPPEAGVRRVRVYESEGASCTYSPED